MSGPARPTNPSANSAVRPVADASASAAALTRLMLSREQLRQVLRPPVRGARSRGRQAEGQATDRPSARFDGASDEQTGEQTGERTGERTGEQAPAGTDARSADRRASPLLAAWLEQWAGSPAARVMLSALQVWWDRHPLRLGTRLAADATDALLQPVAQRHPVRLVLGAALAGAALAWSRPWRWALKPALTPALLAGLLPQLISQALRQMPAGTWTTLLASLAQGPDRAPQNRSDPSAPRNRQSQ